MGWRDYDSGSTLAQFAATLKTEGLCVTISEDTASQILAHNGSTPLKQKQIVKVEEYRGLTEAAAHALLGLEADNSTTTIYYAQRSTSTGGTAQYMAVAARTGSVVNVTSSRANEAAGYNVRTTTTTYSADGTGWSTTKPAASTTGVTVSKSERTLVTTYPVGAYTQTVTTEVKEYPFLTQAQANDLCTTSSTMTSSNHTYTATRQVYTSTGASQYQTYTGNYTTYSGIVVYSTMRYIDEVNGWTVTKTTETTT